MLNVAGVEGSILFDSLEGNFAKSSSDLPFTSWDAEREGWLSVLRLPLPAPGVAELPEPLIEKIGNSFTIHYDILGLTYWMLTRLEEIGRTDLDSHGRFPATSSHALKHGYLDRPVVDEWLHVLGQAMRVIWPEISIKQPKFRMLLSHDVDNPYQYAFVTNKGIIRQVAGDILKRRNLQLGFNRYKTWFSVKKGDLSADPCNSFDWIMEESEKLGLRSAFYFICDHTGLVYDCNYDIDHPIINNLMRHIYARGHEIGLHGSYRDYKQSAAIKDEAATLKKICSRLGIEQDFWGGRMHYLRWSQPETMQAWNSAMMNYDSTLGYADHAGFRCGTCFEYPAYDPVENNKLNLRIRPLIAMECSIFDEVYMGLDNNIGVEYMKVLKSRCEAFGGCFTLLWHNSSLCDGKSRAQYREIIS